jgi:hypothetical protein
MNINVKPAFAVLTVLALAAGCKEKKQPQDIIAPPPVESGQSQTPIRSQSYTDSRSVLWLGKDYKIEIQRQADENLAMVKDESGTKFVDNSVKLVVKRSDGTVAISKTFTKSSFNSHLDATFRKSGILEGFVFSEVDGSLLEFAASVSLPQSDEYIPLEVKIDNFGNVTVSRDTDMDTSGAGEQDESGETGD